jgi:probable F420-dependent oxidoreductase
VRPFKFGLQAARQNEPSAWLELARAAESAGYATFMVPDHLGRLATFPALMAAAAATRNMKLATYVINQDFHHPAVLAQEATSVQMLTDGRLELGIGAGWAQREYRHVGLPYDPPSARVARLEEYLTVVRGLLRATDSYSFEGRFFQIDTYAPLPKHATPPPILVGGGSPHILSIAGRLADIISISTRATPDGRFDMSNIRLEAVINKVSSIEAAAAERFAEIELNMTIREVRLTDKRPTAARGLLNEWASTPERHGNVDGLTEDDVLNSPHMAIGTVDEIVEQFETARERWGFSYLEVSSSDSDAVAPLLERLNGR